MSLNATYTTTTPAFTLSTTPDVGVALPATDPSQYGNRPLAAFLQATTHDIRFTTDGSTPTSSHGMVLTAGAAPFYYFGPLTELQFIQSASGSVLNVAYMNGEVLSAVPSIGPADHLQASDGAGGFKDSGTFASNLTTAGVVAFDQSLNQADTPHFASVIITANAAPADGALAAGQMAIWFDKTNGAGKFMVKAKQADGTVKTGSFAVAT